MDFKEIVAKLIEKDEVVTDCFFFWEGPTLERIAEIRRTDPLRAASLPRPACATARPVLIQTLCRIYGPGQFDYREKVTDLYHYLVSTDALKKIADTKTLMGYLAAVAYHYWLREKKRQDKVLENELSEHLIVDLHDREDEMTRMEMKKFVGEVLASMPNRSYAKILDDEFLEIASLTGTEKAERTKAAAQKLGIPTAHFYVRVSLAKKQFKATALRLMQGTL